jgi:hypothetical protein
VEVQGDSIISIVNLTTNQPEDPSILTVIPTIDGMFKMIQSAINKNYNHISVRYHETVGYPESLGFDPEKQMADDEFGMTAGNLVIH